MTEAAFATLEISGHTEQYIVRALREAGALSVSLVAEVEERVVGHVAFSPVTISDGTMDWYGLGAVWALPSLQTQGIGSALIRRGLAMLQEQGGRGCVLVGDPGHDQRLGFRNSRSWFCLECRRRCSWRCQSTGRSRRGRSASMTG